MYDYHVDSNTGETMYNFEEANRIRFVAKRSIKIVALVLRGKTAAEIVKEVGCNRQLVDYYRERLKGEHAT